MKNKEKYSLLKHVNNSNSSKISIMERATQRTYTNFNSLNSSYNASFCKDMHLTRNDASIPRINGLLSPHILSPRNELFRISSQIDSSQYLSKLTTSKQLSNILKKSQNQKESEPISYQNQHLQKKPKYLNYSSSSKKYNNTAQITNISNTTKQLTRIKCKQCQHFIQQNTNLIHSLKTQLQKTKLKYKILQDKYKQCERKVFQYQNGNNVGSVMNDHIDSMMATSGQKDQLWEKEQSKQTERQLQSKLVEIQKLNHWLLVENKQKEEKWYELNFKLNSKIDALSDEKVALMKVIQKKEEKFIKMRDEYKYVQNDNTVKQRLEMCREQLYSFKLKYQQKSIENIHLQQKIEQIKKRSKSLSSLIGCAIIFNLQQNQKDQQQIKEFMNQLDKYSNVSQNMLHNNSFQFLKFYETSQKEQEVKNSKLKDSIEGSNRQNDRKIVQKVITNKTLYYPNYMFLIGEQSLASKTQQQIIKSIVFVRIRAILDSKYIDYRLFQASASNFGIFCYNFIRNYQIIQKQKKTYLINRHVSESDIKQKNIQFLKTLLDNRIKELPEVQIFREFVLSKWQEDEIYFYLMSRHKLNQGNQLQNYINSGDPSKLILFSKAKRLTLKIISIFNRNIQNFIYHHMNQKKIVKNKNEYIKIYYLLKMLLLIYKKVKSKKILEFQALFQDVQKVTKKSYVVFSNFMELMKKNFSFLSKMEIGGIYRKSMGIYQSQKQNGITFYESFVASSIHKIFLLELLNFDNQLQNDCILSEQIHGFNPNLRKTQKTIQTASSKVNKLNRLWPDSVYILGNEHLNNKFHYLLRTPNIEPLKKQFQTIKLLINIFQGHSIKQNRFLKDKERITIFLENTSQIFIEYLNKIQKEKMEYQKLINLSSKKIGKFFKNKCYEFYNQMLQDVNNFSQHKQEDEKVQSNKRYVKEKIRVSKRQSNIVIQ